MPEELVNQSLPTALDIIKASADKEPEDPSELEIKEPTPTPIETDDDDKDPDAQPEGDPDVADDDPEDPDGEAPEEETSFKAPNVAELLAEDPTGKGLQKRLNEVYKGLAKKDKQLSVRESEVQVLLDNKPQVDYLINVVSGLQDPATYKETLNGIVEEVAKLHRIKPDDIFGKPLELATITPESDDEDSLRAEAQKLGLDYMGDVKVLRKAIAAAKTYAEDAVKTAFASLGYDPSEVKDAINVVKEQQALKESAEWVDRSAQFIINRAGKGEDPFPGVTKEMVAKAHAQYPDLLARELVAKLPYCFPQEYKKAGTTTRRKGPEMIPSGTPKGNAKIPNKHPGDFTFGDILKSRS